MEVTPAARQLLDRLHAEIDERRTQLRSQSSADRLSELFEMFSDDPFFARLYRHTEINQLSSRENGKLPDSFHEPIEMLVDSAFDVYKFVGASLSALPHVNEDVRHEVFTHLLAAKELIDRSYKEVIKLDDLAETACMSRYHFLRLFKQTFKITPHQYQLQCRLNAACKLLRETDLLAIEIAFHVGFESHTSFSALFKRRFGLTPLAYRFRPDADSQF